MKRPSLKHVTFMAIFLFTAGFWMAKMIDDGLTTERESYEELLRNHPYNQLPQLPSGGLKAIPKKDRPDLAAEFEFLKTMDPALQRPAKERLLELMDFLEQAPETYSMPGDATSPWEERGPSNVGGRTRALMFDPNDPDAKKVWAAGVSGGIWFNNDITDPNTSWQKVDDFWDNINVGTLVFDPSNPQVFYAGTGEFAGSSSSSSGGGIWKSTNGGTTWSRLTSTTPSARKDSSTGSDWHYVARLAVAPNGDVYAGTRGYYTNRGGLYRSQDGGITWVKVLTRDTGRMWVLDVEAEPNGSIYAAFSYPAELYKSVDGGETWQKLLSDTNVNRLEFAVNDTDSTVYALGAAANASDNDDMAWIKKLPQGTGSWVDLDIPLEVASGNHFTRGQAWYDLIVESRPDESNTVVIGGISLHRSLDGGVDWDSLSAWDPYWGNQYGIPTVHADQHNIVFRPGYPNEAIFSNDGGVYYSPDVGNAATEKPDFSNRNKDFNVTQFYAASMHPLEGTEQYIAGTQDNGTQYFTASGVNSTTEVTGGDGAFCFIDEDQPSLQISSYIYNYYWVTTNLWQSYDELVTDYTGRFINPADYDSKYNTLYTAYDEMNIAYYKGVENSPSQQFINHDFGTTASVLKFYRNGDNNGYLFVGTSSGRLFRIDGVDDQTTATITEITGANFPTAYISTIEVGANQDELLVGFSSYGVSSLWYSSDGGTSWAEKESNLPDLPVRWALFNPLNREEVLLATELGIWSTQNFSNGSPTWSRSNNGFSNTRVDMLQLRQSDYQVAAATHGRGLFTSNAFQDVAASRIINVEGDLDFGDQWEGTQVTRSLTIQNTGSESLTIDSISLPDNFQADWNAGVITTGSERTVNISFNGKDKGTYSGTVTVHSDAQQGNSALASSLILDTLQVSMDAQPVSCFGNADGQLNVSISDYGNTLQLSVDGVSYSTGTSFSSLSPESYTLWLKSEVDSFHTQRSFTVTEPDLLKATVVSSQEPNCFDEATGQLSLTAMGGTIPYTYSLDGTNFQSDNVFGNLLPGSYEVTVKDANGCIATFSYGLGPDTLKVSVSDFLQPSCSNLGNGAFTASAEGGNAPFQFSLDGSNFSANATFSDLEAGNYQITVRDANNCEAQAALELTDENEAPAVPEILVANGLEGVSDILTLESSAEGDSYQWFVGGEAIAGATGKTYEVQPSDFSNGPGSFQVEVFTAAGCSEISAIQSITAAQADFLENELNIYPNPVSRKLIVELSSIQQASSPYHAYLFDMAGKRVVEQEVSKESKTKIDLKELPTGTYLLQLQNSEHSILRKIQKE